MIGQNVILKKTSFMAVAGLAVLFPAKLVQAFCPACGVAVAGGLEISRLLGIDDAVTGLWIGAITVIMIEWTNEYLRKKNWRLPGGDWTVVAVLYAFVLGALYYDALALNAWEAMAAWMSDKLFISVAAGSFGVLAGQMWYEKMKADNGGKAHFPFEKVVLPVVPLVVMSLIYYFLTK